MEFTLTQDYKSLKPFKSEELKGLCIITGKNGSGKTQLVELTAEFGRYIVSKHLGIENTVNFSLTNRGAEIKALQVGGLEVVKSAFVGNDAWTNLVQEMHAKIQGKEILRLLDIIHYDKIEFGQKFEWYKHLENYGNVYESFEKLLRELNLNNRNIGNIGFENPMDRVDKTIHNMLSVLNSEVRLVLEASQFKNKLPSEITTQDILSAPINEKYISRQDLFLNDFEVLLYSYAKRRTENAFQFFLKKEQKSNNDSISDGDFLEKYPNPWTIINNILAKNEIGYQIQEYNIDTFRNEGVYQFLLRKDNTSTLIDFKDLSSGEKVIIGLIIKLFIANYHENNLSFPDLLVLDEPDAYLHPEMSKLLISVLNESFVKDLGMTVLFTSHSPSTIALAPEDSIYELKNFKHTSLKKISKDNALQILTAGIPTLSINYKNHRQVFVESPTDVTYYQAVFDRHMTEAVWNYKLYFISNSLGKGNCDQVVKVVEQLRCTGNDTCYGIIDWDKKNKSDASKFIYVHGENHRYSIENFLLDPIYLIVLLLEEKLADDVDQLGFNQYYDQYRLGRENEDRLQELTDWILQKIAVKFPALKIIESTEQINWQYLNGKSIRIPKWYTEMRGHDLHEKLKVVFNVIGGKFKNEGELQKRLTMIMVKCYPLISLDTIELLGEIAK